jgi:hypothetical protein
MPAGQSRETGTTGRGSFMVRVWRETGNGWRGRVTHIQSGATDHFQTTSRLWAFMRACLGLDPLDPFLGDEHVASTPMSDAGLQRDEPLP